MSGFSGGGSTLGEDISVSEIEAASLVTEAEGISSNDNDTTIPTSAAVKDHVDNFAGSSNIITVGTVSSGNVDAAVTAASTTAAGKAELATTAETDTGTDTGRVVTPDGLAGSIHGTKSVGLTHTTSDTAVATGNGTSGLPIPADMNGMNIVDAVAVVHAKGVTGTTDVQLRRRRAGTDVDMLSTKITVGDEFFASDGVIDTDNDDLQTGDMLYVDVDAVHSGTAPNGLSVIISARIP